MASMQVQIVVVKPKDYPHAEAFRELAETLEQGLRELGHSVGLGENAFDPRGRNLVLGWHLLTKAEAARLPKGCILYNLEQLDERNAELRRRLGALAERCEVWDYSQRNIGILREAGFRRPLRHVPIGYAPALTRIRPAAVQDLDVLFYGSVNERRAKVLNDLQAAGLQVHAAFGVYGAQRDALIARAKVVLNLHFYDTSIFELVRVSYLLANGVPVVAECHGDTEVDEDLRDAALLVPYEGLVEACRDLVGDEGRRRELALRGFERMAARPEAAILRGALPPPAQAPAVAPDPAVSVVMPTRDRPAFLERALGSLLGQTFRDFEAVVVNDGGQDPSPVVRAFEAKGLRVRLLAHLEARGQAAARNSALRAARGRWIAYLDDDDLYYPDHLETLVRTLEGSGAQVAYTDSMRVVEEKRGGAWVVLSKELAMSHPFDRDHFLKDNLTPVNNVMHARACFEICGPHDESLPVLEDWDYWIRLSRRWDFVHVPKATAEVRWRRSGANITFEKRDLFPPCRERIAAKVAEMLAAEAAQAPRRREAFLFEPDWGGEAWVAVLMAYLEAFEAGEPVGLILVPGPLPADEARALVLEVARRTGRDAFAEVAVASTGAELMEDLRGFQRVQWVRCEEAGRGLQGEAGRRLAAALQELVPASTP